MIEILLHGSLGFILGVAAAAVYNLAHGKQLTKLGTDITTELQSLKARIKV